MRFGKNYKSCRPTASLEFAMTDSYMYAALLLHKAGKKVDEQGLTSVVKAAGVDVDQVKVKALASGEVVFRTDVEAGMVLPASKPEDVERTYRELKRKGVEFSQDLTTTSWGKMAILKDLDGNEFEIS